MKYKLSQKQLDELSEMEFNSSKLQLNNGILLAPLVSYDLEPITEPLPKPVIRNVEDLKALEGWEATWCSKRVWYECDYMSDGLFSDAKHYLDSKEEHKRTEIRQISLPSNSFLVSECIEPEIEVPAIPNPQEGDCWRSSDNDMMLWYDGKTWNKQDAKYTPKKSVGEIMEDDFPLANEARLIVNGLNDAQLEQISQIIDNKLKERGMLGG